MPSNVGSAGGRGKVKGDMNGRRRALSLLDTMLGLEQNRTKLYAAMQAKFDEDPFWFFQKIVIPLMPKEQDNQAQIYLNPTLYQTDNVVFKMDQLTVPSMSGYRVRLNMPEGHTVEGLTAAAQAAQQRN